MSTKKEQKLNRVKNEAYSSLYSFVSFLASWVYLIIDITSENSLFSTTCTLALLFISIISIEITLHVLRKGIEHKDHPVMKWKDKLNNAARSAGYLSFLLLTITLLVAIARFFSIS